MQSIALDTSADLGNSVASGYSVAYTCTGSNRLLIVAVMGDVGASSNVSGITYGGVALTKAKTVVQSRAIDIWILSNPASGQNNIVFTFTSTQIWALAASYVGTLQTGQPDADASGSVVGGTALGVSVTTTVADCWLLGVARGSVSGPITAGTNTTARQVGNGQFGLYDSNEAETPAGSFSLNWTMTAQDAAAAVISIEDIWARRTEPGTSWTDRTEPTTAWA